jgi:hypothetical protein
MSLVASFLLSDGTKVDVPFAEPTVSDVGTVMSVTGNDLNVGSLSSPVRTFKRAYALCPSGGTITVRAGVYEEGSTTGGIAISKPLTVRAYPGESVWFDGSTVVSGWTGTGPWVKTGWTFNAGNTSGFTTSDKPNVTYYMDQLFINDVSQVQVATTTPKPGEFSVVGGSIYLGSDPTGKTVRVSQYRGLFVVSQKVVLSNIGVRRYASGATATNGDATASQGYEVIYFGGTSKGSTIENCRFVDNSHVAVSVGKSGFIIRGNTFMRSGKTHISIGGSTGGDDLVFTGNTLSDSNLGGWPAEPTTAAVKIVRTNGGTITDNVISNTFGSYGIWLDLSCTRCVIARNTITGTAGAKTGILFEISGGGLLGGVQYWSYIVDNKVSGPYQFGITLFDSSYVKVWNNTVDGSTDLGFRIIQDSRPTNGILNVSTLGNYNVGSLDFLVHNIEFVNNKIGTVLNYAQVAAYNMTGTWAPVGDTMFDRFEGNSFAIGTKPAVMWGAPVAPSSLDGRINYATVDKLDARTLFVNKGWKNISGSGVSQVQPPSDVASLIKQ